MEDVKDDTPLKHEIETFKDENKLLANNLEKFRLLYENLPLGYQSLDLQGNFIIINQAWLDLLGYSSKEEVIGKSFGDFITESDLFEERFPKFKECGITKQVTFEMIRKDGSIILVSIDGRVSYDKDGKFIQTHCILYDITEKHKSEELLKKNQENLSNAQRIGHLGFWDWNPVTGILYWSDESFIIYGYKPQEFEPTFEKFKSIVHPDDIEFVLQKVDAALKKDEKYKIDFRFVSPSGEVGWIQVDGEVIRNDKGEVIRFFGTQLDITERKKAEDELQNTYDALELRVRERTLELQEKNIALKVLLTQQEEVKNDMEQNILSNIQSLIQPYIMKLKRNNANLEDVAYLNLIESNLEDIVSPFSQKLSSKYMQFTGKEIEIANLIKEGKKDKEIMEVMNIAFDTVKTHRKNIRKKLGIHGKGTNLRNKLLSM